MYSVCYARAIVRLAARVCVSAAQLLEARERERRQAVGLRLAVLRSEALPEHAAGAARSEV